VLLLLNMVDYTIIRCTEATLEGRLATATLGGSSRIVEVSRGSPKEGVLSPLLRCLVVNKLTTRHNECGVYTQGCANDICLLEVGKLPNTVSGLIQWAVHTVEMWCDELELSVNPDKTVFFVFTRRRKLPGFCEPHLFGMTLHRSVLVKNLGEVLNSRLAWRKHVDVKVRKAHTLLWVCRRAYGVRWGLRLRVAHWLYFCHPLLLHSWYGGVAVRRLVPKILSRIQRFVC